MDSRLEKASIYWSAWEVYRGRTVIIPDLWKLYDFEYLPADKPDDSEKQSYLALGWRNMDIEAIVALGLFGKAALDPTVQQVSVEITRLGGAELHVIHNKRELVVFPAYDPLKKTQPGYFATTL